MKRIFIPSTIIKKNAENFNCAWRSENFFNSGHPYGIAPGWNAGEG